MYNLNPLNIGRLKAIQGLSGGLEKLQAIPPNAQNQRFSKPPQNAFNTLILKVLNLLFRKIFRNFTLKMSTEEQLQLAYAQIVELKEVISRLEAQLDPQREQRMREMYQAEARRTEDFYRKMMDDMRVEHARDMDRLTRTLTENLNAAHELQVKQLKEMIASLQASLKGSRSRETLARGKRFGRKSEKGDKLGKTDDENREDEKNDFDGTGTPSSGGSGPSSSSASRDEGDAVKRLQKALKRRYPGAEIEIRTDYSKQKDYTENAIYHSLGEYFTLGEGETFATRDGEIDINLVKVIIRYPEKIEEHIYETATVRSADAEDYRTASRLGLDLPCPGCCFGTDMLTYIIAEKYCYNKPFDQIVSQLANNGFNISKSTLGDNVHRVIAWVRTHMTAVWEAAIRKATYWMLDETPLLVGCGDRKNRDWSYLKKYVWTIRATLSKLVWFVYESGSRGKKAIEPFLKDFIGFYTTDGYVVYKIFDTQDGGGPRRSACLVHIRRCFVDAIVEDHDTAMWFIEEIGKIFAIEYHCKKMGMSANERLVERLKTGSTADIMAGIEARLKMYEASGYAECGALMAKAVKYALSEWPAMKRVLENGAVEISNNLAEQMMRHIKMNLKTASNIGSEESALDNAFMFSLIESCKLNGLAPEKYIAFLLRKLKDADAYTDKNALLPCFCTV